MGMWEDCQHPSPRYSTLHVFWTGGKYYQVFAVVDLSRLVPAIWSEFMAGYSGHRG